MALGAYRDQLQTKGILSWLGRLLRSPLSFLGWLVRSLLLWSPLSFLGRLARSLLLWSPLSCARLVISNLLLQHEPMICRNESEWKCHVTLTLFFDESYNIYLYQFISWFLYKLLLDHSFIITFIFLRKSWRDNIGLNYTICYLITRRVYNSQWSAKLPGFNSCYLKRKRPKRLTRPENRKLLSSETGDKRGKSRDWKMSPGTRESVQGIQGKIFGIEWRLSNAHRTRNSARSGTRCSKASFDKGHLLLYFDAVYFELMNFEFLVYLHYIYRDNIFAKFTVNSFIIRLIKLKWILRWPHWKEALSNQTLEKTQKSVQVNIDAAIQNCSRWFVIFAHCNMYVLTFNSNACTFPIKYRKTLSK